MKLAATLPLAALSIIALTAAAQSLQTDGDNFHYRADRQIVVFENGHLLTQEGGWSQGDRLRHFATTHASMAGGSFVVFHGTDGVIHALTDRKQVAELASIYAPMRALNQQQAALAQEQQPLAAQQHALAEQQHAAATASNYAQQGDIAREQGKVGHLQGVVGKQQGAIGQQQGEIGRAFYVRTQQLIDACLRDSTCPAVGNIRDVSTAE